MIDPTLELAHKQWQPALEKGISQMHSGNVEASIATLTVAVNESARYHPLFHFLESGLNTELGLLLLELQYWEDAAATFTRAIFLDHNNETAKAGLESAHEYAVLHPLPVYPLQSLTSALPKPDIDKTNAPSIHTLRKQAKQLPVKQALKTYHHAISICEDTHQAYHKAAAVPWLWRARAFKQQGELALAKNDARRGLDLDATHPDLLSLSALTLA